MLNDKDLERYSRQIVLPDFGEEGQRRLRESHVLVAGMGGLGSPVAMYLTCAGLGRLTLVDDDSVELSNLNRQILHWESDIGNNKVKSASGKLKRMNSTVELIARDVSITEDTAHELLDGVDVAIDCLDTMATRFVLNEACVRNGVPFVHGGVRGLMGEVTAIIPGQTPCLECLFRRGVERKELFPIFGATAGLVAAIQTMEAVKLLSGLTTLLTGRMLYINQRDLEFMSVTIEKNPECPVCGSSSS
jgi:adenylyltransferase/sulfurtransferase